MEKKLDRILIRSLDNARLLGKGLFVALGFATVVTYNQNHPTFSNVCKPNPNYVNSVYQAKKDSLENAYKLQIDSLAKDHQTKLDSLVSKIKITK